MFNPNRKLRECSNQVIEFDPKDNRVSVVNTTGINVGSRKHHCAAVYKGNMIVYGGQSETGFFYNEMLVLDLTTLIWQ